jgi:hypothetical protein
VGSTWWMRRAGKVVEGVSASRPFAHGWNRERGRRPPPVPT